MLYRVEAQEINLGDRRPVAIFRDCVISNFLDPPFIVSGAKSNLVVVKKKGVVRSVIRPMRPINEIYNDILFKIIEIGKENGWENVFPNSRSSLKDAYDYVKSFGPWDTKIELINNNGNNFGLEKLEVSVEDWVPDGMSVVITHDRSYLGDIHLHGSNYYSILVHNPGRAIAIMFDENKA